MEGWYTGRVMTFCRSRQPHLNARRGVPQGRKRWRGKGRGEEVDENQREKGGNKEGDRKPILSRRDLYPTVN